MLGCLQQVPHWPAHHPPTLSTLSPSTSSILATCRPTSVTGGPPASPQWHASTWATSRPSLPSPARRSYGFWGTSIRNGKRCPLVVATYPQLPPYPIGAPLHLSPLWIIPPPWQNAMNCASLTATWLSYLWLLTVPSLAPSHVPVPRPSPPTHQHHTVLPCPAHGHPLPHTPRAQRHACPGPVHVPHTTSGPPGLTNDRHAVLPRPAR